MAKKTTTNNETINETTTTKKEGKTMTTTKKATTTKTTTTNNTTIVNSIINVELNGKDAIECALEVKARLESFERDAFNMALLCAYGTGVTIPSHTDNKGIKHGEATCENPKKQVEFCKVVNRAKGTVSDWIKAMRLIIEAGHFEMYASGQLPFSYEKVKLIYNTEVFQGEPLLKLFSYSVSTLESLISNRDNSSDAEPQSKNEESSDTETTSGDEELAILTYEGKTFSVPKEAFEKWLKNNAILIK